MIIRELMILALLLGLLSAVDQNGGEVVGQDAVVVATTVVSDNYFISRNLSQKLMRLVPRRSPMLPQDSAATTDLAMQSRAVDKRVQLEVREGEPEGTLVGKIPTESTYTYRFNEPPQEFMLDPKTGEIRTTKVLDREALSSDRFDFVVLSSQPTYPIEVRILVLDINDNSPEFPEPSIAVSFSESAETGTKRLLDAATDRDTPENGVLDDYFIVDGNMDGKFRLEVTGSPTGETKYLHLETTGKLDREQVEFYSLNICARDRGQPPRTGYLLVNVTVLDVNDNSPTFPLSEYIVTLNESAPVGTKVFTVHAIDKDTEDNSKITYFLSDDERRFTIDPDTGTITTAEPLRCYQQSCIRPSGGCPKRACVIPVFARDNGSPRQDGRTFVTVSLLDTNDHDPVIKFSYFPVTATFATVDENAPKNSNVAAVVVMDDDEGLNGETKVEIRAGNELGHFRLYNTQQGFDVVRVNGRLDREEIPKYNLTIVATDKGMPPRSATAYLVIHVNDINDHEPVFQQSEYTAVLSELAPIGSFVASITATDADSGLNAQIFYEVCSGNEQGWFAMDNKTGLVTTVATLDREVQGSIELYVSALDGGPNPKYANTHLKVTILDENDEAPCFSESIIEVMLSEDIPPHSLVATLTAVDNDQGTNGTVAYSFHSSVLRDYPKTFALDALTGQLTTVTALDRETVAKYTILVIAKDQGTPVLSSTATVVLTLEDVNDNSPIFYPWKYLMSISENAPPGTIIGKVTATDADARENSQVRYFLESGGDDLFVVDEKTGEITLRGSLRTAHKTLYELTISARDTGDQVASKNAVVEIIREEYLGHLEFNPYNGYEFSIYENRGDCDSVPSGYRRDVGTVYVSQYDNTEKVSYAIVYGDPKGNFHIDETSGVISAVGCLDRERVSSYSLQLSARANLAYGQTIVNITVLDVNDNSPRFPKEERGDEIFLRENAAVGQEVCLARARDRDTVPNARITYSLTHNPGGQFRIAENSSIIYLDKPIRSLPGTILYLEVTATDNGSPQLFAQHQIKVTIEDVNDHTPVFRLTSYETSLPESTPVNDRFFSLTAHDKDFGVNSRILYSITDGNAEGHFGIFPDGQLYVKTALDREERDYYALEVTARDQGSPPRSSVVPLVVHVIDENDNAPEFTNSSFNFLLRENEPPDIFVGKLLATDRDVGRNADLIFSLPATQQDFVVDPKNGFIKSLRVFDRELLVTNTGNSFINLEATVTDNGVNRLRDRVKVTIHITDVNDNVPQFQRLPYRVQVSEGTANGTQLLRVYTIDSDEGLNGDVFYSLEDGNQHGHFMIDEATGQISLVTELDRETSDTYVLTVVARDAGLEKRLSSSATVRIDVLDENDNTPRFVDNKTQISVLENTPINTELLRFKATDNDLGANSELTFTISAGNKRDAFYIDPLTGILYLKKPLDYEELVQHRLNITCSDGGYPKLSSVTTLIVKVIDTNDNSPVFPSTAIVRQIREGIPVKTPIVTVTAEDPDSGDNGLVSYSILSQEPEDQMRRFDINSSSGMIYTLQSIDREEVDTFKLMVVATDRAQPPSARLSAEKLVIVIVEDVNDNAPIFISMSAVVLPSLHTSNLNHHNFLTKEVEVAQLVARDLDSSTNGLVTYELLRSSVNSDMFKIHRSTGVLTMKLPRSTSNSSPHERVPKYQVGVRATDEAVQAERRSSETYVTLIVPGEDGDDQPIWEHRGQIEGSVYENEPASVSILKVSARSRRANIEIEYYVTNVTSGGGPGDGPQVERLFDVDMKTGVLSTAAKLDRETGAQWYEVELYAIGIGGTRPSTTSTKVRVTVLDKNDVAPTWGPGPWKFHISEEAPLNSLVTILKAHDPDTIGTLTYTLVPNHSAESDDDEVQSQFKLYPNTGQLRLAETLDRETKEKYVLKVRAGDGLQYQDIVLHIQVTDTNDNAPTFQSTAYSFDVPENMPRGSRVGQVVATDADAEGSNSQLSYELISDWANDVFSLNPNTGVFTLTASLDYEQVQHYILVVQATDGGTPVLSSTVTVYCNVVDLNDNAPIFETGPYAADIMENATVGTSVLTVAAQDLDYGDNAKIVYAIASGDEDGDFGVAPNGTLITRRPLDRERKPLYNLMLSATDSPPPPMRPLSSTVQVTVTLLDVNNMSPEFISPTKISIIENAPSNTVVMAIKAVDRDEGRNGYVEYSLEDDGNLPFTLGSVDGLLRVSGPLDREQRSNYTLKVTAKDRGEPPRSTSTIVIVTVLDENDNSPVFDPRQYTSTVAENASIGASVLQVSATDRDEGANGRVQYSIATGDDNRDFTISEDGGVIRVAKNLNFERKFKYHLTIRGEDCAAEVGGAPRVDTAQVTITVLDINDNAPVFLDSPYLVHVMEEIVPPSDGFIIQVKAYDADTPPYNDQVRYFLKEGDTDLFRINASTGDISLLRQLDRELVPEYTLTLVAMDTGSPPLTGSGIVRIVVLDANDHVPVFARQEYKATVVENTPAGTWVTKPHATDKDEGLNAKIRYNKYLVGDKAERFSVDPDTGDVFTTMPLDREETAVYHFTLTALDSSPTEPRGSAVNLTIYVTDANDNAPRFSSPRYTVYLPNPTKPGDFVFGAKAIDDDDGENSRIIYQLLEKDDRFVIDLNNGVIRAAQELTGNQVSFQLQIQASDCGADPQHVTADLIIYLWQHDLFPSFRPSVRTKFTLPEDVPEGMVITRLNATTPKTGPSSNLIYGIAGGNVRDALRIDSHTGEVVVASGFDYETAPYYEAWIEVRDSDSPSLRSVLQLLVNVTDANDNAPVMEAAIYNATVMEEDYPPVPVIKVTARDRDSGKNGQVTYHLVNASESFIIDSSTGQIETNASLDREKNATFELVVEARDEGDPRLTGTATVLISVLDKNDNSPRFTRLFSVNVTENAEINTFVIRITSNDLDIGQNANVSYSFTANPGEKFSIDALSGNVTVAGHLDREEKDEYSLMIAATDGAWQTETPLTITIQDQNDNAPEFDEDTYFFHFPELQSAVTCVGQVAATDRDKQGPNSVISYSLLQPSDLFTVDPATGDVFSKRTLRYKHTYQPSSPENLYSLTVIATDNGKPPMSSRTVVHVSVVDANNNAPRFEQRDYLSSVPENFGVDRRIIQLVAHDDADFGVNAEISYSLNSDFFGIEERSGWVYVRKSIDGIAAGTVFLLSVRATDKGVPPQKDEVVLKLVISGENRHAPVFDSSSYLVIVPENEAVNNVIVTVLAIDGDSNKEPNGIVRYNITGGNERNKFSLDPVSGEVSILEPLDYDLVQEYRLTITATDLGFEPKQATGLLTVQVSDINDNPPTFNQSVYEAFLPENSPPDSFVYKVVARDIDSPKYAVVQYKILGGSGKEHFRIREDTGEITSELSFDYEEANEYTLDIAAANPDSSSQMVGFTTVVVHITGVNEFYPKFIQPVFHMDVSESADVGTSVGMVQATDQDSGEDGRVYYLFVGSSNDRGFSIGAETGIVVVSRRLDRETQNRAVLTVMAKNGGGIRGNDTDEAQVIVSIQDGNDPPEFLQDFYNASISEAAAHGTRVLTVSAVDKDIKPQNNQFSYSIIGGNFDQAFKINPQSGDIETAKQLDRETLPTYDLTIGAIDTGTPPQTGTATVHIKLLDVNDNGPVFDPPEVIGYVSENEPAGTSIMTLSATDPDLPPNGAPFTYRLVGGKQNDLVTLDKHSGVLRTTRSLDRETTPQLDLVVEVEDSGVPRMKNEHTITVIVTDQNDSPSTPRSVHVIVYTFNKKPPLGKIADVRPNDPDVIGHYSCKILPGADSSAFSIPTACDLYANNIAPGKQSGYLLNVSSNDGRHSDVISKVTVTFVIFSNATIENSVTLQVSKLNADDFLSQYYGALQDLLQEKIDDTVTIFSISETGSDVIIHLALQSRQGYRTKHEVTDLLVRNQDQIQALFKNNSFTIGYSPCKSTPCENGGSCSDRLAIYDDARITDSQSLILTSSRVVHEMVCRCRDGFTGDRCEKRQDPCSPNPCLLGGQCRRLGYDFQCVCPIDRDGKLCELERGDVCASNPCRNGGSCRQTPDTFGFFCLCRTGYKGNQCEVTDSCRPNPCLYGGLCVGEKPGYRCSCTEGRYGRHCERSTFGFDELSYMTFPALDSNTNDITIVFATTKPDALLLYNYAPQTGGRSDFIVLELRDGRVVFSYGGTRSAITTINIKTEKPVSDGDWHKVTATRNGRVVSLSVSACREHGDVCDDCKPGNNTCYVDDVGPTGTLNFNNNPLLLGGLDNADPVLERPGQVHSDDFVGCINSVSINGRALNLSNPLVSRGVKSTCTRSHRSPCLRDEKDTVSLCGTGAHCYDKWHQVMCQCGFLTAPNCHGALEAVTLSDGGFVEFKVSEKHKRMQLLEYFYGGSTIWHANRSKRHLIEDTSFIANSSPLKTISLMFRTVKPNGILIYAATNKHFTLIELRNGQLIYASLLESQVNMSSSIEGGLADGHWHNLTLHAYSRGLRLLVDNVVTGDELDLAGVHDFLDPYLSVLSIGGVSQNYYYAHSTGANFEGCLANFTVNNEVQPFNGSGSIFKDVLYHGKVSTGCRGLVGISTAAAADPLSVGITLVIVFFVILLIIFLVSFIVFRILRRQNKESAASVVNKNTNAIMTGNPLVGTGSDNLMSRHENTYISDTSDLRGVGHMGPELISKKYKEREINSNAEHRPQRPDIIEREVTKSPPIRDEHPPLPPPAQTSLHSHEHNPEPDIPEHYDLENASSIAPSDIDIVYHYKGYRDGMRKYKATPPPIGNYGNHHKHTGQQHRHTGPFPPRTMPPPNVNQPPGPTPKLLQSTPLARLSPSSELSAQQPRILTLHDISGKPLQSALLATTSSSGGVGKDALNSNSERSLNSPIMSQLSGSTASRKAPQSNNENSVNNVSSGPMGLTAEEIERLNSRPRTSSLVSTLDAVSSSSEARGPPAHGPLHHHRRHTPPVERLERRNSSTTDESGNDSFTCSEIEYDNSSLVGDKRSDNLFAKQDDEDNDPQGRNNVESSQSTKPPLPPNVGNYDGFDSSFRGSLSTLVASDDDLSTHMGGLLYGSHANNGSPTTTTTTTAAEDALGWDYLLNWGPNFESLVGVFIDIAELPDSTSRVPRLPANIAKPSEEYV